MLGLLGTLDMAARSLGVEEQASEVTGNNLANVNNASYSREQLVMGTSIPTETMQGEEGTGVTAMSIAQVRDGFLDGQIVSQNSVTSSLTTQQSTLQEAEAYLNEEIQNSSSSDTPAGSENGIAASLTSFFNSFETLANSPTELPPRQTVIADGQTLANQFNQLSSQLRQVRDGANQSIQSDVTAANQDLSDIATLNQEIVMATANGGTADTLVDERQAKLEDLASKVNISTSSQSDGSINVSIGGVTMVSDGTTPDQMQTFDAGGGQILVQAKNAGTTLNLTGGSIGGAITARDGGLATLQNSLDTLASNLATSVNSVYSAATGQNFFTGSDAATIAVNASLVSDPSTLQAGTGAAGDNSLASALGNLANQNIAGLNNQTFAASYAATVSSLGDSISGATDQLTNSEAVGQMLSNQRSSVSGVSTDEEMTNLIQYQKAYEASAELVSTLSSMLETVIQMAG